MPSTRRSTPSPSVYRETQITHDNLSVHVRYMAQSLDTSFDLTSPGTLEISYDIQAGSVDTYCRQSEQCNSRVRTNPMALTCSLPQANGVF